MQILSFYVFSFLIFLLYLTLHAFDMHNTKCTVTALTIIGWKGRAYVSNVWSAGIQAYTFVRSFVQQTGVLRAQKWEYVVLKKKKKKKKKKKLNKQQWKSNKCAKQNRNSKQKKSFFGITLLFFVYTSTLCTNEEHI